MTLRTRLFPSLVLATFFICLTTFRAEAACISLTSDLMEGSTDDSTGGAVTELQTYLVEWDYLSVTPTGYFGPATFAAVQEYQTLHNINPTGYVGPLTRAALQNASCSNTRPIPSTPTTTDTTTAVVSSPVTSSAPVAPISNTTPQSINSIIVTSPQSGMKLYAGKSFTIQWTGKSTGTYNVLLEDANGIGKGFIASNLYQTNSYVWQVGNVTTSNSDGSWNPPLPSGTYRIHVVDAHTGAQTTDEPSPTFSLVDVPLTLTSISPSYVSSSASANGPASITVYGTGFDRTTTVTLQGMFTTSITPEYVFPDGSELLFYVPTGLTPGRYGVGVSNTYGSFSSSAITLNITN